MTLDKLAELSHELRSRTAQNVNNLPEEGGVKCDMVAFIYKMALMIIIFINMENSQAILATSLYELYTSFYCSGDTGSAQYSDMCL